MRRVTFRLYIVSGTANSVAAQANLRLALAEDPSLPPVEIIDVMNKPDLALTDGVLVTPTLVDVATGAKVIGRLEPVDRVAQFLRVGSEGVSAARSASDSSERR